MLKLLANTWGSCDHTTATVMRGSKSVTEVLHDLCGSRAFLPSGVRTSYDARFLLCFQFVYQSLKNALQLPSAVLVNGIHK